MARRGRPPSARAASARIVRLKLRLYPGEDDDLIAFFGGIPAGLRAACAKRALRSGIVGNEAATEDAADGLLGTLDALILE